MVSFFWDAERNKKQHVPATDKQDDTAQDTAAVYNLPGEFVPDSSSRTVISPTTTRKPSGAHHPVIPPPPPTIANCSLISNGNIRNMAWAPPASPAIRRPSRCLSVDANGQPIPIRSKLTAESIDVMNFSGTQPHSIIEGLDAVRQPTPDLGESTLLPETRQTPTADGTSKSQQSSFQTVSSSLSVDPVIQVRPLAPTPSGRRHGSKDTGDRPKRPGLKLRGKSYVSIHEIVRKVRNHLSRHPERQNIPNDNFKANPTYHHRSSQYILDDGQVQDVVSMVVQEVFRRGSGSIGKDDTVQQNDDKHKKGDKKVFRKLSCLINAIEPQPSNLADPATTISEPQTAFFVRSSSDGQVRAKVRSVRPSQASLTTILSQNSTTNIRWLAENDTTSAEDDATGQTVTGLMGDCELRFRDKSYGESSTGFNEDSESALGVGAEAKPQDKRQGEAADVVSHVITDCGSLHEKALPLEHEASSFSAINLGEPVFQGFSIGSQLISEVNDHKRGRQDQTEHGESGPKRKNPKENDQKENYQMSKQIFADDNGESQLGITSFPPLTKHHYTNELPSPSACVIPEEQETRDMYHLGIDARPGGIISVPKSLDVPLDSIKHNDTMFQQDVFGTKTSGNARQLTRRASEASVGIPLRPSRGSIPKPPDRAATNNKFHSRSRSAHFGDLPMNLKLPNSEPSLLQKLTRKLSSVFQSPVEFPAIRAPPPSLASNAISRKVSEILVATRPPTEDEEPEVGYVSEPEPSAVYQAMTLSKPVKPETQRRSICSEDNLSQKMDAVTSLRGLIGASGR